MKNCEEYRQVILNELIDSATEEDIVLYDMILRANHDSYWSSHENGIRLGTADNLAEYATLTFHEAGYKYLNLGTSNENETDCYVFSRHVCERLKLPYSHELERWSIEFVKIINDSPSDQESFIAAVDQFPLASRRLLMCDLVDREY
jgi:hypothetical protein